MIPPVQFALLGTSRIARSAHLPQREGVPSARIIGIAGRDAAKARRFAEEFNLAVCYPDFETLLADRDVDAVIITVPNGLHADCAIRAAAAGKHVLCEKPLALTRADALRIAEAVTRHRVHIHEGFMYRENPKHARVLEIIASGRIGVLRHVHTELTYPLGDWKTDARVDVALGGGSLFDAGCYAVDAVGHLFGQLPTRVSGHQVLRASHGVDETFHGTLEYANGATATITSSLGAAFTDRYFVIGSEGRIDVPFAFPSSHRESIVTITGGGRSEELTFPAMRLHATQLARFVERIRARPSIEEPALAASAIRNATTLELLKRAATERRPLDVSLPIDPAS